MTNRTGGSQPASRVRVGRVYDARESHDDLRVLVDRLWPRGLSKARADLDDWCKVIAPSTALRSWYGHDPDRFVEFERRYRRELDEPERADAVRYLRELAERRTLILLTATRRPEISEAAVLADILHDLPDAGEKSDSPGSPAAPLPRGRQATSSAGSDRRR